MARFAESGPFASGGAGVAQLVEHPAVNWTMPVRVGSPAPPQKLYRGRLRPPNCFVVRTVPRFDSTSQPFCTPIGYPIGVQNAVMAESPKAQFRLDPIYHAYLTDLARIGYGKGKSGVMRRFILNGITAALEGKVIATRTVEEFGGSVEDDEDNET